MLEKNLRSERERNENLLKEQKQLREQMGSRWPEQRLTSLYQELQGENSNHFGDLRFFSILQIQNQAACARP